MCRHCHAPERAAIDCPCGGSRPRHDYYGTHLLDNQFCLTRSIYDGSKGDSAWDFEGVQVFPSCSGPIEEFPAPGMSADEVLSGEDLSIFDFSNLRCNPMCPPSAVCPFNLPNWVSYSSDMPDTNLRNYVIQGLHDVFRLKYKSGPLRSAVRNNPSAYKHKQIVSEYLLKELARGSIAGPFSVIPIYNLHFSRFGVIPKSGSNDWRLILDLSYPKGACVNMGISDEDARVSYQGLDVVIDKIISAGHRCHLAKFDVAAAYRNIPVHPSDRYLLGMQWMGKYFVDMTLSFGGRSAPGIFPSVADVLTYMLSKNLTFSSLSHYLDDFLQITEGSVGLLPAEQDFDETMSRCEYLGVPIKDTKTVFPCLCLEYLGVILDTERMEARLSLEKISALREELDAWASKRSGSKKSLLSLIGKLMYACQVVHHGRPFLRRLINKANALEMNHFRVHLSSADREDLAWWVFLLNAWNGVSLFSFRGWEFLPHFPFHLMRLDLWAWG